MNNRGRRGGGHVEKKWMPALIFFLSLVPSLYFTFLSASPYFALSYILIYSLTHPLPFLFSLLSAASLSFISQWHARLCPGAFLWYPNVSLNVLSVCLSSPTFSLLLPILSLRICPPGLSTVFSNSAQLSCTCLVQCVVIQSGDTRRQSTHSFAC